MRYISYNYKVPCPGVNSTYNKNLYSNIHAHRQYSASAYRNTQQKCNVRLPYVKHALNIRILGYDMKSLNE